MFDANVTPICWTADVNPICIVCQSSPLHCSWLTYFASGIIATLTTTEVYVWSFCFLPLRTAGLLNNYLAHLGQGLDMDQELLHLNVLSQDVDVRNSDMVTCTRNGCCRWHSFMIRFVLFVCVYVVNHFRRHLRQEILHTALCRTLSQTDVSIWMHLGLTKVSGKHQAYSPFHARLCYHCASLGQSHIALLVQHFVS